MRISKKLLSIILVCVMVISMVPTMLSGAVGDKVRVIVRNSTYSKVAGAKWDGQLLDKTVDIDGATEALAVIGNALVSSNISFTKDEYGYFSIINGLEASPDGGWMYTINDWFSSDYPALVVNGDVIDVQYSYTGWGADIGSGFGDSNTKLKSITLDDGYITPKFKSDVTTGYKLKIPTNVNKVNVAPSAINKNYQARIYKGSYRPAEKADYIRNEVIPVSDGDKIYIGVGNANWPSMNLGYDPEFDASVIETVYEITVEADEFYNIYDTTKEYIATKAMPTNALLGIEWGIIGLARSENTNRVPSLTYYKSVVNTIREKKSAQFSSTLSTENSRVILALKSLGYDATKVDGKNLLTPLQDLNFVKKQGVNGSIWALLAFNAVDNAPLNIKNEYISYILEKQLASGAMPLGTAGDIDLTAMAIQALAPYYNTDNKVKTAVDKALAYLATINLTSAEVTAQVVIALTSLGIDPDNYAPLTKSGKSVLDALASYYVSGGGFKHNLTDTKLNAKATEQGYLAFVSYYRLMKDKVSLYDMSDVVSVNNPVIVPPIPVKVTGVKVKNSKKKTATITWRKLKKDAIGYKVEMSKKSSKKGFKVIKTVKSVKTAKFLKKKLKKGKTYYFRVRAYNKHNGKTIYGKYSTVKKVKIKK